MYFRVVCVVIMLCEIHKETFTSSRSVSLNQKLMLRRCNHVLKVNVVKLHEYALSEHSFAVVFVIFHAELKVERNFGLKHGVFQVCETIL